MENASKALIIAGSILLAILIIGVGIYIFNSANVDVGPQMSQMEVNLYNQEYLLYEGIQSGKRVKEVLMKAVLKNAEYTDGDIRCLSTTSEKRANIRTYGFGIRGTAEDIMKEARKITGDTWVEQLRGDSGTKGVFMPGNIMKIIDWIRPNKRYVVSFTFFENGRIREIIINDV